MIQNYESTDAFKKRSKVKTREFIHTVLKHYDAVEEIRLSQQKRLAENQAMQESKHIEKA